MGETLVIATHNAHKTGEMRALLGDLFDEITDLTATPGAEPPEETGETFAENSALKALTASRDRPGDLVLADDSGLEVHALGGAPGVYSSRYAGADATDEDNRRKLLAELGGPAHAGRARSARFRCVVTLARDGEELAQFDGNVEGHIADTAAGEGGFGYDPLFVPTGYEATFAELPAEVKNELSHRGRAIEAFRAWWRERSS